MPLALIAIGSVVCETYEVIIIDARIEEDIEQLVARHINDTLLVGVTSLTGAPLKDAITFSKLIKRHRPELPVVWGGWHTSLFPKQVLKDVPEVDIAVQGQGEVTFKEIVDVIATTKKLSSIKGIVFREQTELIQTPPRPMEDMNNLPRLNYELIDVERYFEAKGIRQFDFITSIGCFFRCTFCADPFVFNRKYNSLKPERVFEDLKFYYEQYQFEDLNFQDETFFTYPKQIIKMAGLLKDYGKKFTWAATMRADQGSRMSYEDFKLCKEGGLRRLLIGVESGSQEMMDWLRKDIKVTQVLLCADRCKALGIHVIFPFIIGFPKESDTSVIESQKMIRKLALMSPKFDTPIFYFKPYPGTQITREVVEAGEYELPITIQEWSEFDYVGSRGPWVDDEKYDLFEKYKFYLKLNKQSRFYIKPLAKLAKWRIQNMNFNYPIEKRVIELFKTQKKLS
jgi:radical SAM superfamily enzyme YgiQ (UPF0313 family)